jgi:diguanylate cyclase (GGDEF)-like protein
VAAVLHRNAERCPRVAVHGLLGLATILVTVSVAQSTTPNGIVVAGVSYVWIGTYTATFHDRPAVLAHLGAIGIGLAVGLWAAGATSVGQTWFFLMATIGGVSWILNDKVGLLRQEAMTDPLTKALSRRAFRAAAEVEMARAARAGHDLTLVLLDLDDFKRVNDEHGHAAGDAVLTGLAGSWRHALRAGDVMGRYGGDEFTVLLPATDAAQARALLDRMRRSNASCSWSAGVAPWRGQDFDEWLRSADAQLYAEKTS